MTKKTEPDGYRVCIYLAANLLNPLIRGWQNYYCHFIKRSLNDLWRFRPSTGLWTWMGGSNTADAAGVYGTRGAASVNNMPGGRYGATSWIDASGNVWLFGGYGNDAAGAFGAHGIGEPCVTNASAIYCAQFNATGKWPDWQSGAGNAAKMLKAMGKA